MMEAPRGLLVEPIPRSLGLDERPGLQQFARFGQHLKAKIVVFMVAIVIIKNIKSKIAPYIYTIENNSTESPLSSSILIGSVPSFE